MDTIIEILVTWGGWGLFIAGFVSGSIFPFSSEVVFAALIHAGMDPWLAVGSATLGNTLGGMTCYGIGLLGKSKWILRLGISPEKLQRAQHFLAGRGAMMGFFAFLPGIGEAVALALGLMRSNAWITCLSMLVGKFLRYVAILAAYEGIVSLW